MPIAVPAHLPRRRSSLSNDSTHITTAPLAKLSQPCFHCEKRSPFLVSHTNRKVSGSRSLLGSMQESLLHGMTSGLPSRPHAFTAVLCTTTRKINTTFNAQFYTWDDGSFSPFVGSIDMSSSEIADSSSFPGVKIKERGKLQLIICNAEGSLVRVIVMNYNIRKLKDENKVFIRQSNDDYTIHVNFAHVDGQFHVFGDMKVIFHNHSLMEDEGDVKRLVGKPSKVDLHYYTGGCHLCNESAVEEDDDYDHKAESLSDEIEDLDLNEALAKDTDTLKYCGSGTAQLL